MVLGAQVGNFAPFGLVYLELTSYFMSKGMEMPRVLVKVESLIQNTVQFE